MRYYLVLLIVVLTTAVGRAQVYPENALDSAAYIAPKSIKARKRDLADMTPDKAMLIAVYNRIKYPRGAREGGVGAAVQVEFTVDTSGLAKCTDLYLVKEEALAKMDSLAKEPFIVTAYSTGGYPTLTYTDAREQKARIQIAQACQAAIEGLPRFEPGRKDGRPVTTSFIRHFIFRCE